MSLDISQAQRITLRGGENQLELILPMQMGTAVEITGTALDTRGRPLAGRRVTAAQRTSNVLLSTGVVAPVAADGSFRISGLSPGTYVLETAAPAPDGSGQEYATAEVSSQGGAMSGVQLIAEPPALGSGRIVVKETGQPPLRPQSVQLGARNLLVRSTTGSGLAGTIAADWTFTLRGRPGLSIVRPLILPEGWALESVTHHGIDVTDIGVKFNPRRPVTDLEVTITSLTTHLTGKLTDPAGLAMDGYPIVVFSRDAGTWRAPTRFVQQKFADPHRDVQLPRPASGRLLRCGTVRCFVLGSYRPNPPEAGGLPGDLRHAAPSETRVG